MFVTQDWEEALREAEAEGTGRTIWEHGDGSYAVATAQEMIDAAEYEAGAANVDKSAGEIADEWTEVR